MEKKLTGIFAEALETEEEGLSLDTDFRDEKFDFDSLKGFAILVMIEEEFGIRMSAEEFVKAKNISDVLEYIKQNG